MYADIEINESSEDKKAGRTQITMTACTIHDRGKWNRRGLTWLEEYVQANIDSMIGAPFVVCFADDKKTMPLNHGTESHDEKGNSEFHDSDAVGSIQKAWIDSVEIDGMKSKKLIVSGYLYNQRYPNFVKWLKNELELSTKVKGSVEATGKGDSKHIIYEGGGNGHDENGNWIIGRIPVVFDFSGLCILLPEVITEADPGSEVIEVNVTNNNALKEEEIVATEKDTVVIELNDKIVELNNQIGELNSQSKDKDSELAKMKEDKTELNSLLVEANKNLESMKAQIAELNSELEPLKEMKTNLDKEKVQTEVNSYFEKIKNENGFTETELNSLNSEFVEKCDLEGLKAKEAELCIQKFKEMKKIDGVNTELNSVGSAGDLYFSTKTATVENNTTDGAELFQ